MQKPKKLEKIEFKKIKGRPSQSIIINNFFMLLTIGMVCLALLFWANYIRPTQIEYEQKQAAKLKAQKEYNERVEAFRKQREEEIKRSQIYNSKVKDANTH
jgi:predicted Holliday junction resolvase-like endonuclease